MKTGRCENIAKDQRLCKSCNMRTVETEYHFILVCPKYRELRTKYFQQYFCHWPSLNKFDQLMNTASKRSIYNLSKYIFFADKKNEYHNLIYMQ